MQELIAYAEYLEEKIEQIDLPNSPSNLYDPLRYFLKLGGKRIRPILTLLSAEMFGKDKDYALDAALAIELFHNFTLIHDDIMDQAPLRRNKETVHVKWNTNIAILSGDVLFVKAYEMLTNYQNDQLKELFNLFNKTASEVCEGQQLDMDFEKSENVSIDEYIEMIRLKTSVLLGCALKFGGIIGSTNESNKNHIYTFGQHVGIAFQIQDDILDLFADPDKFGKQIGGDVIANKKTLLNLKAKELANEEQHKELIRLSNEENVKIKVEQTLKLYLELGVREACENIMREHYNTAINALSQIQAPEKHKNNMLALADYLMVRNS